jgi:mannose-6-phosphate isomerase-like protein (cupin superfamily)
MELVEKAWGYEEWIVNNEWYCGKRLVVHRGFRCSMHKHRDKHETFYVDQGKLLIEWTDDDPLVEANKLVLTSGAVFTVPPGRWHRFTGVYAFDSVMYEFSMHHEDSDSYRHEGMLSGPAPTEVIREYA